MPECRFATPVIALVPITENGPTLLTMTNPREGIAAICRHGLGDFRFESVAVIQTVEKLALASRSPTQENLDAARDALAALAAITVLTRGRPAGRRS